MISEIVSALGGMPRHVGTEGSYEEVFEDFEVAGSNREDRTDHMERPIGIRASQSAQPRSQCNTPKLAHYHNYKFWFILINFEVLFH